MMSQVVSPKPFVAVVGLVLTVGLLSACGGGPSSASGASGGSSSASGATDGASSAAGTGGLALVIGAHANAPTPTLPSQIVALINQATLDQSQFVLVSNQGTANIPVQGVLTVQGRNPQARTRERENEQAAILAQIQHLKPSTPQDNLLAAISLAGRSIASAKGTKTIVVIDSGLQTVAPVRFQDAGMLASDPADVGTFLQKSNDLPDLAGMNVTLMGFGDTAPPQAPLSLAQQKNVQAIWTSVLTDAGASVRTVESPLTGDSASGLPAVTTVAVQTASDVAVPAIVAPHQTVSIQLTQSEVAFQPNSAQFLDRAAADLILRPLADRIQSESLEVHLVGSTATAGTPAGRDALSKARAEAVKQRLVAFGVSSSVITTEGVGSDGKDHVPDLTAAGVLLPGPAARNRKVTVELSRA